MMQPLRTFPDPENTLPGDPEYRFAFNGMEKDDEIKGMGNSYTTKFRQYDPRVGRWWSIDPKPNPSSSNYISYVNNPIRYVDALGDTVARFDYQTGGLIDFVDDGKEEWSGLITGVNNEDPDNPELVFMTFQFNDQKEDVAALKNGVINKVKIVKNDKMNKMLEESGVNESYSDYESEKKLKIWGTVKGPLGYALDEGEGAMDYKVQNGLDKSTLYIVKKRGYNDLDFGNFMWGRGMKKLNINLMTSLIGAQYNNFKWGKKQIMKDMDKGPGTYEGWSIFDSQADQNAIIHGWHYPKSPGAYKLDLPKREVPWGP